MNVSRRFLLSARLCGALLCLALSLMLAPVSLAGRYEENTLKAAMVLNIARFTEWPTDDGIGATGTLRLCVFDTEGGMLGAFRELLPKRIHRRELVVRPVRRSTDLDACELLFVRDPDRSSVSRLLAAVERRAVLSVGDMPGFAEAGGIINLVRAGRKLRFEVNLGEARAAGLKISSRLLKLATIVGEPR
ncbi:MAG TPA: YfiR family protein [Chromatiaceae bacterium]|nr:YfiR family protein [Chromatiaceae bacterium]